MIRSLLVLFLALSSVVPLPAACAAGDGPIFRLDLLGGLPALEPWLADEAPRARSRSADPAQEAATRRAILAGPTRVSLHPVAGSGQDVFAQPPVLVVAVAGPLDRATAEDAGWGVLVRGGVAFLYLPRDADRARRFLADPPASARPARPPAGRFAAGSLTLAPVRALLDDMLRTLDDEVKRLEPPCLAKMKAQNAALAIASATIRDQFAKRFAGETCPEGGGPYGYDGPASPPRRRCPRHGTADAYDRRGFDPAALVAKERSDLVDLAALVGELGPLTFEFSAAEGALDLAFRLPVDLPGVRKRVFLRGGPEWIERLAGPGLDPKVVAAVPADSESFVAFRLPPLARAITELVERSFAHAHMERRTTGLDDAGRYLAGLAGVAFPEGPLADLASGIAFFEPEGAPGESLVAVARIADPARLEGWRRTAAALAEAGGFSAAESCGYPYHVASRAPVDLPGVAEFGLLDDLVVVSPRPGGVARVARVLAGEDPPVAPPGPGVSLLMRDRDAGPGVSLFGDTFAAWGRPLEGAVSREGDALVARFRLLEGGDPR